MTLAQNRCKLAPNATSLEDEERVTNKLARHGVKVSPGSVYHLPNAEKGWFRLTFALKDKELDHAIEKLMECLC